MNRKEERSKYTEEDKIKKQVKDPVSNSPSDARHTLQQRNNDELRERGAERAGDSGAANTPYEMGDAELHDDLDDPIVPDDPIEAEQVESEKLRFGFSFEPQEGNLGEVTEDEGDLTSEQRKTGNRYRSSMGVGDDADDNVAADQELRVTDQGHIGMAYGEDSYVNEDDDDEESR